MGSCLKCKYDNEPQDGEHCKNCVNNAKDNFKQKTRADWIRSLPDEDLAKFLNAWACDSNGWCDDCESKKGQWCNGIKDNGAEEELQWLRQPADEPHWKDE